jgi:hypothetical protein
VKGRNGFLFVDYGKLGLKLMTEPQWRAAPMRLSLAQ